MIKKHGEEFWLYTADGSRILGKHPTKELALKQEQAIEISKHAHEELVENLEEILKDLEDN